MVYFRKDILRDKVTCLSRKENDESVFAKEKKSKQRWNFFPFIKIEGFTELNSYPSLVCANESYKLERLCYTYPDFPTLSCTLIGTNEIVELNREYVNTFVFFKEQES